MNSDYVKALETKADWLKWSTEIDVPPAHRADVARAYQISLRKGETFFMNSAFCDLVDHARRSVPDNLVFEPSWLTAPCGWMYIKEAFKCPDFVVDEATRLMAELKATETTFDRLPINIQAVGWIPIDYTTNLEDGRRCGSFTKDIKPPYKAFAFLCFLSHPGDGGFGEWAYFTLREGDKVIDRITEFETNARKEGGAYENNRETSELHEVRWIYTAFHLMAQKLAIQFDEQTDRTTKRRAEREKKVVPSSIKVVSLRRLEQHKQKAGAEGQKIDWKWQWAVRGHWRNQFFKSTNSYKQIFIESFIKGPQNAPFKPITPKLFVAAR